MKVILASTSPRRKEILTKLGISFKVLKPTCNEEHDIKEPAEIVRDLSLRKANDVHAQLNNEDEAVIIAADTIVYFDGRILEKPADKNEAINMLTQLQNNWHTVYTGVTIIKNGAAKTYCEESKVHMRRVSNSEIKAYVETGKPLDKAGAYGIQDDECDFVDKIEGQFETIVGLPCVLDGVSLKEILS